MSRGFAVLSDVHGNRWALEAVLAHAAGQGLSDIIHLGDVAWGVLDPSGAVDLLRQSNAVCIAGNQDREVVDPSVSSDSSLSLRFTRDRLSRDQLSWLAALPACATLTDEQLFLCHGTPASDTTYLLEEATSAGVRSRSDQAVEEILGPVRHPVALCGHTHLQRLRTLPDGRLVLNPGSVGLPAYGDDVPCWHAMESRSPHARYASLVHTATGWQAQLFAIEYDWESAGSAAAHNGRPDWAYQLRNGRVEPSK